MERSLGLLQTEGYIFRISIRSYQLTKYLLLRSVKAGTEIKRKVISLDNYYFP